MRRCVTCGVELHPERAQKYDYCTASECQAQNAKGLTIVAVGVNKAADQFQVLDERTREEMASGKYHDQRRATFGRPARPDVRAAASAPPTPAKSTPGKSTPGKSTPGKSTQAPGTPARSTPARSRPAPRRVPWTKSQERLALLYNEQGLRPDDIARKLGLSRYVVTQIILAARNRGKL